MLDILFFLQLVIGGVIGWAAGWAMVFWLEKKKARKNWQYYAGVDWGAPGGDVGAMTVTHTEGDKVVIDFVGAPITEEEIKRIKEEYKIA